LRRKTFAKCTSIFVCQGSPSSKAHLHMRWLFLPAAAVFSYPSPLWGGWHVVSAANDVTGGGSARKVRKHVLCGWSPPPDRPSAGHPKSELRSSRPHEGEG
jgi:hypothetical protein